MHQNGAVRAGFGGVKQRLSQIVAAAINLKMPLAGVNLLNHRFYSTMAQPLLYPSRIGRESHHDKLLIRGVAK